MIEVDGLEAEGGVAEGDAEELVTFSGTLVVRAVDARLSLRFAGSVDELFAEPEPVLAPEPVGREPDLEETADAGTD